MASESSEEQKQHTQQHREQEHEDAANADATQREAYEYWGYLLKSDKCGTPLLDRLLKGIAQVICKRFEPSDSSDLTPTQIAAWYRDVGGDYDMLFRDTPPSSIAFIYRSLGAFHSLQPAPTDDGYSSPTIPALKHQGFVTWQTIQLLLGPEDHVPFLQKSVEQYDVVDPATGSIFPKVLPKQCFPDKPDDAMEVWYEGVAARLKKEAEEEAARARAAAAQGPRTSTDQPGDGSSADERTGAFKYFEDPMYRRARTRPPFMRHVSKQQAIYPLEDRGGRAVTQRVRHMLNPFNGRRKRMPGRYDSDSESDQDATPIATNPPPIPPYSSHKRPHPARRESSLSTTDSDSDGGRPTSRRRTPELRQRRSHEPMAPREYFPPYHEGDRRNSHQHYPGDRPSSKASSPQPQWRPTTSPLFATQVAHMEARNYYDRRPALEPRSDYRPAAHSARWGASVPVSPPREAASPYGYDRDRNRDRHGERNRSYDVRHGDSGRSRHRRRSTEDAAYPFERGLEHDTARRRSHDRAKDMWEDGDSSRERRRNVDWDDSDYERSGEHSRDGERERRRYGGVQDGVSGRRYPVVSGPY